MICLCRHADVQEDVLVAEIAVILRVVFFVSCVSKIASSSTTTRLPGRFTLRCIRLESSIIGSDREVSMTSPIHSSYPSLDRDHKSGKQTQDTRALSHTSFPSPAEHLRRVSREWIPVSFSCCLSSNECHATIRSLHFQYLAVRAGSFCLRYWLGISA